jgi:hypothetical protein
VCWRSWDLSPAPSQSSHDLTPGGKGCLPVGMPSATAASRHNQEHKTSIFPSAPQNPVSSIIFAHLPISRHRAEKARVARQAFGSSCSRWHLVAIVVMRIPSEDELIGALQHSEEGGHQVQKGASAVRLEVALRVSCRHLPLSALRSFPLPLFGARAWTGA